MKPHATKRFIILIDTLYDNSVKLMRRPRPSRMRSIQASNGYEASGIQAHRLAA